jgi:dynein heavy chain
MYVFGGYGGDGYARRDFNDLHVLDCYSWEWIALETTGDVPPPRSGHQAVAVGTDLYVFGGWNSVEEFDDMYVLDTELLEWTKLHEASGPSSFGAPRWNFSALSVFAVPYWKIFMFGGNSGHLIEDNNPQGTYKSDMLVYEIGRGEWSSPTVIGECPQGRSDTDMLYDLARGRIVLFGGWANRWFGDVHVCDVLDVVGPPYSVSSISPVIGPITGNTQGSIEGMGFSSSSGNVVVRFACTKGFIETKGEVVSDEEILFETPPFMKYGPVQVEVRVAIGGKTFTNSSAEFRYFSVTDATRSVAFGPGLLTQIPPQHPVQFIVQARDRHNFDRVCGFDEWTIQIDRIVSEEEKKKNALKGEDQDDDEDYEEDYEEKEEYEEMMIEPQIIDQDDGTYLVTYTPPSPGMYQISIDFDGTFEGVAGSIRGSPFTAHVEEGGDPENGQVDGPVLLDYIKNKTKEIKDYCGRSIKDLKKPVGEDIVDPLLVVKSRLMDIEKNKRLMELHMDMMKSALQYLKTKKDASVDKLIDALDHVGGQNGLWVDLLRQVPLTTQTIARPTKHWTEQIRLSMDTYKEEMKAKLKEFKKRPFWVAETGYENSVTALDEASTWLHQQRRQLEENLKLCETFEFPTYIQECEDTIQSMGQDIEKMRFLWTVTKDLDAFIASCAEMKWIDLDPEELEDNAKVQMKATKSISTQLRWCNAYSSVDRKMKDFMNTIPLIALLLGKCMRERHWESMHSTMKGEGSEGDEEVKQPEGRTFIGEDFPYPFKNKNLKLKDILELNIHLWANEIEEICDRALKEEKIENTLVQLEERWQSIVWLMEPYNETDVPLLKIMEEDYEGLENDQLTVQGMLASRFVKQFETEVQGWQLALANVSDIFLMLTDIQRTWSYLEPLFIHSEEVKRELPETAERFQGIDVDVRRELKRCWELRNIKAACNQDGLDTTLETILEQLEICKKSLVEFLDGRRRQFPRYYFTSESDLLDILSNGSTPSRILVHIPKIYLATKTLVLSEEMTREGRPYATSFIAGVGKEEVDFEPHVPLEGKVETYMQTVMDAMESTIFANLKRCLRRYNDMPRPEWVMCQDTKKKRPMDPAQCILLTLCVNYVSEVEEAFYQMKKGSPNALSDYNKKQIDQLSDLIRLTQSNISKGDRQRVMVCITLDTHGRDVVQKMVRERVDDISCFQWQSQLKHKYRVPPSGASHVNRKMQLRGDGGERAEVAIADAIVPYDYEYLGNGPRLVITPLTDRIYVTATQALNLKMGCAPAGPAGTGKTETTKDLANSLAKCCYVFNCSPEMDYLSMGNIYKGLASSGSWGCFDEFNRLIPEVLSVCSVQFKAVCDGVKADNERITIEGDEISLDPTVGVFITMNPGYLGRSELPEGLKALFRPITVMVPDLVLICENMLMAEGFVGAKELASKFYGLYSLLKELLSKAPHYDWGLRAVKSVLVVAGGFKRAEPDIPEDVLLMRALRDFNTPKIVKEDEVVFFGLLGDLFPGLDPPRKLDDELESLVHQTCINQKLWPDETFRLKIVQLKELLEIRHCVFVMGPPGAGKTSCWKTLCGAQGLRGEKTKFLDINPKSITTHELYGSISLATREWRDGLLSKIMRDLGLIPDEKPKWIVLDGDLDANWIESMNSVMDDNRMLTLASNERIPLKAHMKMLFEIRDLRFASPATVSRAGILYISTDDGTQWRSLIHSWVDQKDVSQEAKDLLTELFERYVFETLRWLKKNVKPVVYLEDMNLVTSLLYMLDATFQDHRIVNDLEAIPKAFVYCMIWSMGSALTMADDGTDYKKMFSDWWRSEW